MSLWTRIAVAVGIVVLTGFFVLGAVATLHGAVAVLVIVALALVVLIGAGNLLYGKDSHGAAAQARKRPAQQAADLAAARAADARRAVADAERRGERYCPIESVDPAEGGAARST
ncbi:MAG TPA: hypothetical protein VMU09_13090 [Acidimicrobiales bacterium]|nr:hypothetical protein [Acidimicrobiales bacterium]